MMIRHALSSSSVPLVDTHDALWLDLDGVVYRSEAPVAHAVDAIAAARAAGVAVTFLTNNASRTPDDVATHLRRLGLGFAQMSDVATAAQAIAAVMAVELRPGAPVLVIGGVGLRQAMIGAGLEPRTELADDLEAVVQGYAPDLGWQDLAKAAYAIQSGARWFASNDDLTIPTKSGTAPGNGSLVQAVRNAVDVDPVIAGKPHAPLFELASRRTGAAHPLMVGDRIDTDIVGARRTDIASLWVATGVDSLHTVSALTPRDRPDFVAPDLRSLALIHRPVIIEGDTTRCGDAQAMVRNGEIETSGRGLDVMRATVGLAWHIADTSGTVPRLSATLGT